MRLNHIGVVVPNILDFAEILRIFGLKEMIGPGEDPIQKVLACFITTGEKQEVYIELLEPTADNSPVNNFLKKRGGGLHHLCFEVENIEETTKELLEKGFQLVSSPVECVAYDHGFKRECTRPSRIAFFLLSNKILIELLQKGV